MIFSRKIGISDYTVPCPGLARGQSVTLCHISDVHTDTYGDYSPQAVEAIRARKPDLLLCTGDLLDCRGDADGRFFFSLLDRVAPICTVASPGNHEKRVEAAVGIPAFLDGCRARGVHWLDNAGQTLTVRGATLRLFGYIQPFYSFTRNGRTHARLRQDLTPADLTAALGECPADGTTILLAHDPAPFAAYAGWGAPLTLSGHIHGGIVRLPLLGGVFSPARTLFPKYDAGLFRLGNARMIVSRGLSASECPRIFNPPEVAFITLTAPQNKED